MLASSRAWPAEDVGGGSWVPLFCNWNDMRDINLNVLSG